MIDMDVFFNLYLNPEEHISTYSIVYSYIFMGVFHGGTIEGDDLGNIDLDVYMKEKITEEHPSIMKSQINIIQAEDQPFIDCLMKSIRT